MLVLNIPGCPRAQSSGSYAFLVLRHRDRHGRRPTEPLRWDWAELISQANNSILRSVIKRAPHLETQIRGIRYEVFDLPNLTELSLGNQPALATATNSATGIQVAIFRRPIEVRASSNRGRVSLLRFAIAESLAELLNTDIDFFNDN